MPPTVLARDKSLCHLQYRICKRRRSDAEDLTQPILRRRLGHPFARHDDWLFC